MKTVVCKLCLPNHQPLTATASAADPAQEVPVVYSGDLDGLSDRYDSSTLPFLEFFLRARAAYLKASIEVHYSGEYENTSASVAQQKQRQQVGHRAQGLRGRPA